MKKGVVKYSFICFLFIILLSFSYTLAKYKTNVNGESFSEIAFFIVEEDMTSSINMDIDSIDPGETKSYNFSVRNYNDEKRLEVNTNYTLSVYNEFEVLPLVIELYKNDDMSNQLLTNDITDAQYLTFEEDQIDEYTLKVTLPIDAYEFQNQIDSVTIKIDAAQID